MSVVGTGTKACLLGSALLFGTSVASSATESHHVHSATAHVHTVSMRTALSTLHGIEHHGIHSLTVSHNGKVAGHFHGISCVPYARQVSGIQVAGNAWQWWDNAAGQYARGDRPESGSVLNFRSNGRMRLGHVAVVSRVVNAREIVIDQANWPSAGAGRGGISHDVAVVDVSEANNWSAVRVELGRGGEFGSVYPTYGFIYNRPDNGYVTASVARPAPQPVINPVPSDLRPAAERPWHTYEEVAEAPSRATHRINFNVVPVSTGYSR